MGDGYVSRGGSVHALWFVLGIVVAFLATTVSALECRGTDISGATSCWSESSSSAMDSFPINLADLPNSIIGGITHRMRDNDVSHYRVSLNPGDLSFSWLALQIAGTLFNAETTRHVEDPVTHREFVRQIGGAAEIREMTRIRDHGRTGWLGEYRSGSSLHRCYAAVLAFEPSPWAAGSPDEMYEMILRMKDCTGRRSREQIEEWLYSLQEVPEGYNRE